ncbi:MAG: hypothetical protein AAF203_06225 [Pseudomonadota bacterium]
MMAFFKRVHSLLICGLLFLFGSPVGANTNATGVAPNPFANPGVVLTWEQAQQLALQQQNAQNPMANLIQGVGVCFNALARNTDQGLSSNFDILKERNNNLLQHANRRFETLRQCRSELLEAGLRFEERKTELERENVRQNAGVRDAELQYRIAIKEIKDQCKAQARDEWATYRERVYGNGVIQGKVNLIVGFDQRVQSAERTFYSSCISDESNRESAQLAGIQLQNAVQTIKENVDLNNQAISDFMDQTRKVQSTKVKDCEDQERLNAYNEAVVAQTTAEGSNLAKRKTSLGLVSAVNECVNPISRGLATDATSSNSYF